MSKACHAASWQTHTALGSSEPISLEEKKKSFVPLVFYSLQALAASATNTTRPEASEGPQGGLGGEIGNK